MKKKEIFELINSGTGSPTDPRDVLGVLKVQHENLDYAYLANWAEYLGLSDDLIRAFTEAGI